MPIRLELGPRDLESDSAMLVRRVDGEKVVAPLTQLVKVVRDQLEEVHTLMFNKALKERDGHLKQVTEWSQVQPTLNEKCLLLIPFCGGKECEAKIKADTTGVNPCTFLI